MLRKITIPFRYAAASIFIAILALVLFSKSAYAVSIPSNFFTIVDTGGANDVNSAQNDLTQMGRDDSDPNYYEIFLSWDSTDFSAQRGNACALFDTDNDTNINYAVCVEVENVPNNNISVVMQTSSSPQAVTCNNNKDDRCGNPSSPISFTASDLQTGDLVALAASPSANLLTDTDPFANLNPDQNYPNDSTIRMKIKKSFLPTNAVLVNVCSYPSIANTGNNNPFDCIVNPGVGFIKIDKVAPDGATKVFNFTVNPGAISKSITGAGTTGGFAIAVGTNYSVAESVPANWQLDSAACTLESGTATGSKSGSTVSSITVQSGKITTCTFTNSLAGTAPSLAVLKSNDANHNSTFSDIETVPADVAYPYVVTYQLVITNSSGTAATLTTINDNKTNVSTASSTQSPACASLIGTSIGANAAVTCYYDVSFANANTAQVINTATVTATNAFGTDVKSDTATVNFTAQSPHISLTKSATETNYSAVGNVIHYKLVATNDGNVTLTNVSISDPKLVTLTCTQPVTLAPGATLTCTGSYTVTQADVDAGKVDNTASVSGKDPNDGTVSDTADESVPAAQAPHITLTKSATETTYSTDGDVIHYKLVATNDGNVTLTDVSISDPKLGTLACTQPVTLAPGATLTCTGSYTVTLADVDAGKVDNIASASGKDPDGGSVSDTAEESVPAAQAPHITLTKNATETTYSAAGDVLHYKLVATNDGSVTLTDVSISDPKLGTLTCTQPVTLIPGATLTCTGSYPVTQDDVDTGGVDNTASTTGTPPTGPAVSDDDSENVPAAQAPHISISKSATQANYDAIGDVISYTMVVTNDGNVTLSDVSISDPKLGTLTCTQPITLAPSATLTCTGSYLIVQDDLDAGQVENTASTTGAGPNDKKVSDSDDATVPAVQSPHITLTKSATETTYSAAGDVLHYKLVATNDGNVTLTDVSISDPKLGTLTCTQPVTLIPGATLTCTGSYPVTQDDVDAGKLDNIASVSAKDPNDGTVSDTDDKSVPAAQSPHITVLKAATEANYDAASDIIHYTITATNDGNVTLTGVNISDPKLGTLDCTQPVTLTVDATLTCTGSYTVKQADVDGGVVNNTASTTGTPPQGDPVSDDDSESVPAAQSPHLSISKLATQSDFDAPGDVISYTIVVTNDGNVTLSDVSISDAKLGTLTCTQPVVLAPSETLTCTGSYTVTQGDVDAGKVDNTATTTGTAPNNEKVNNEDTESVPATQSPHITVLKVATEANYDSSGDIIHYTITATNDGNVTLTGVSITDAKLVTLTCSQPVTLAPGASLTCTGSYTVTQDDVNAGQVDNTASATGTPPTGDPVNDDDSERVPAAQSPHLTLVKRATQANYDAAGDVISYTLVVTNDGNVTLNDVSISDTKLATLVCTQPVTLAPGASLTCTGSYTVTQDDVNAGQVDNTATATGTDPDEKPITDEDSETVPAAQAPHLSIVKSATQANYDAAGDVISYTLVVTNDGNVTLDSVTISDTKLVTLVCTQPVTLAPGATLTCTGSYTVTQDDVDAGQVDNTATATATDPDEKPVTDEDSETVPAAQAPHITVLKVAAEANYDSVDDVIHYTITATNDGNVTLSDVSITDAKLATLTCTQPVTLAPGATLTCTGSYTIKQDDVDAGHVDNTAGATGTPPGDNKPVSDEDTESVPAAGAPHISITKNATQANYDAAGDVISYTLVATNDGSLTLTNVSISDAKLGTLTCTQPVTLAPTETLTCTGSYTVSQADVDAGKVDNTASTTGTPPTGPAVSDEDSENVPAAQAPHISIVKSATQEDYDAAGDVISYTLVATNDGNVTLTNVSISDAKLGTLVCTQPVTLAPGESLICTGSYTVTQADIDAGSVDNTGTATGSDPDQNPVSDDDSENVPAAQAPHINLVKSAAEANYDAAGDLIHYTLVATNDGNVTLTGVSISDAKLGTLVCTQPVTLAPGESLTCTGSYIVTQSDVDGGEVENSAGTTGTPPGSDKPVTDEDEEIIPAAQAAHIDLVKRATQENYAAAGDVISYTLVATNDGNVTLTNVTISDPKLGTLVCTQPVTLTVGQSLTCTGSYTVIQSDVDAGSVDNIATVIGTDPAQNTVADNDSENVPAAVAPHLNLAKVATQDNYDAPGDVISYTLVATNDGSVTLTNVTISDPKIGALTCTQPVTLTVGESLTCTGSYTVTQGDIDAGEVDNVGTSTGTPPNGPPVTGTTTETVPAAQAPHISIVKTATQTSYAAAGDVISYTLIATNDGNVTLTAVRINDSKIPTLVCTQPVTLTVGESLTCTGSYTVTQDDLDAGSVDNTGTTIGMDPNQNAVTDTDVENVPAAQAPQLLLDKQATEETYKAAGDVIHYTYVLTNNGNVTLFAPIAVSDNKTTVTCPATPTSLAPGESITCTATYTIVAGDVDAEEVTNIAVGKALDPEGNEVLSNQDEVTVTLNTSTTALDDIAQPGRRRFIYFPSVSAQG